MPSTIGAAIDTSVIADLISEPLFATDMKLEGKSLLVEKLFQGSNLTKTADLKRQPKANPSFVSFGGSVSKEY